MPGEEETMKSGKYCSMTSPTSLLRARVRVRVRVSGFGFRVRVRV